MNKRNENRSRMILAVLAVINKFKTLWESVPVMLAIVNELIASQLKIEELRNIADSDITGKTKDKKSLEEILIDHVYTIASSICVIARRKNDMELLHKSDYNYSELELAREGELVSISQNVAVLARENITLLAEGDINEGNITELERLTSDMKNMIAEPRVSVGERKTANINLKKEIDNAAKLLEEQLDRMMIRFKKTAPEFFAAYMNARHIVAYGIRHESESDEAAA